MKYRFIFSVLIACFSFSCADAFFLNRDNGCECGDPYSECRWNVSIHGGVVPTHFCSRGDTLTFLGAPPSVSRLPRFSSLYDLPYTVGAEVGYMLRDRVEIFLDGDYSGADHRTKHATLSGTAVKLRPGHYRAWGFYLGARYYFPTCWCQFTPFFGAKIGFVHRNKANMTVTIPLPPNPQELTVRDRFLKSSYAVSGGIQLGVNWDVTSCLAVVLKAELLYTGDWESTFTKDRSIRWGTTGSIRLIPVTLGLRYTF